MGRLVHAMCRMKDYLFMSSEHKQELDDAFDEMKAAEWNLTNTLHGIARDHEQQNERRAKIVPPSASNPGHRERLDE